MRIPALMTLLLLGSGCPGEQTLTPEECAAEASHKGDRKLAAGRLHEARSAYDDALRCVPNHARAALGSAVIDVLLLPDSAPVAGLLDTCNQPRFDIEHNVFGPDGLLVQEARAQKGEGDLRVYFRPYAGAAFVDTGFELETARSISSDGIQITLGDSDVNGDPAYVYIDLTPDDLYSGDDVIDSLSDGTEIDVKRIGSSVMPRFEERFGVQGLSGSLRFHGGTRIGDAFTIEFIDVTVSACESANSWWSECHGEFRLVGSLRDTVSSPPQVEPESWPMGEGADDGPPFASALIVAIERCGPVLTTDLLTSTASAIAERLDATTRKLDVGLAQGPEQASFVLPRTVLRSKTDLQLNGADLLALRALTRGASALLRLSSLYRYLDVPLSSLTSVSDRCYDDASLFFRPERTLINAQMADHLSRVFLTRVLEPDLDRIRGDFESALSDAIASLRHRPSAPGVLAFQSPRAASLSNDIAGKLESLRSSLGSDMPVPIAGNPLYFVHLKTFFEDPVDREHLLSASGADKLVTLRKGDPSAPVCDLADDSLELVMPAASEVNRWSKGALAFPADLGDLPCSSTTSCPSGYECIGSETDEGRCRAPAFSLFDVTAENTAMRTGWPAFLNPDIQTIGQELQ